MLTFNDSLELQGFVDAQNKVNNHLNYLHDILLPAIKSGDFDKLKNFIIYKDKKLTIYFHDDEWKFRDSDFKGKSVDNINFSITKNSSNDQVTDIQHKHTRNLINEMKCAVIARMYFTTRRVTLKTIASTLNTLRITAREMHNQSLSSFSSIDITELKRWKSLGYDFSIKHSFTGLNMLFEVSGLMSFPINFNRLTHRQFNIEKAVAKQYTVIPPRLYFALLNQCSEAVSTAYKFRDEIELATKEMLFIQRSIVNRKISGLRSGTNILHDAELKRNSVQAFLKRLNDKGVALVDNRIDSRWMEAYEEIKPELMLQIKSKDHVFKVGGKEYNWVDFRQYIQKLSSFSGWLCLCMSGMRCDELFSIHPDFGAQYIDVENEFSFKDKERIYLFTTLQSKITGNSQKKDDVYVTSLLGYKAFYVLNSIHAPFRQLFPEGERNSMFACLTETQIPHPLPIASSLGQVLRTRLLKFSDIDFTLTSSDINYLNTSESQHTFKIGDYYKITTHQARRSLAYYLIGYELCSFPALKQQLGHFSMAMTRWYARNATSYHKFWQEVVDERTKQQADIYVRIFKRLANGERIAGGKGKAYLNTIAKSGNDYFEDGVNKRLLTVEYWKERIRTQKDHLHAIAPGMYCTNNACEMRIAIDLTECVSCEFDYIENVVYAESARMNAMIELNMLIEQHDLNASSASLNYMKIKAAERIMSDLEFDYESYQFTKDIEDMVILVNEVML